MGSKASTSAGEAPTIDIPAQGRIAGARVPLRRFSAQDDACVDGSVVAYLGIPFAQPPVGDLRWKRPQQPAPAWRNDASDNVRSSQWRADPVQDIAHSAFYARARRDPGAPSPLDLDGGMDDCVSEDCLYLNIWVPDSASRSSGSTKLPVLVWVYGGAFVTGAASQSMFDGARLAHESGCIIVSVTYRVGIMGFLGSRQLAASEGGGKEGCGNYGLWDIVAGFEWVQKNIAGFGGDASNVTAFGESAGAIAIHALLISTATPSGLFARACLESGTALTVAPRTLPSAQATFEAIASRLGIAEDASDDEKLEKMRAARPQELLEAAATLPQRRPRTEYVVDGDKPRRRMDTEDQWSIKMDPSGLFAPIWDGVMIGEDYLAGAVRGIPRGGFRNAQMGIVLGCTADEGSLFCITMMSVQTFKQNVSGFHPDMRSQLQAVYGTSGVNTPSAAYQVASCYSGDNLFVTPVIDLMVKLAQQMSSDSTSSTPSYGYIHSHRPSTQLLRGTLPNEDSVKLIGKLGALHMAEINFVFGFDGSDQHVFARSAYGQEPEASANGNGTAAQRGFTPAERALSLEWMRGLARFAHGEAPWPALVANDDSALPSGELTSTAELAGDLHVRLFDNLPRLGASSQEAQRAVAASQEDVEGNKPITIRDARIRDALMWTERVLPADLEQSAAKSVGRAQDKHAFWTDNGYRNMLLAYYGDERIRFIA